MAWKLEASESVLDTPWLRVKKTSYLLPSGTKVPDYYVIERTSFVLVVPTCRDCLVMVRQYRPATDRFYLSLPAGYMEEGETPEDAAARELAEEAGLTGADYEVIGVLDPLPGYIRSPAFIVTCDVPEEPAVVKDREEIAGVHSIPMGEVLQMIGNGEVNEMQAVSAILLARLKHPGSDEDKHRGRQA